ncbi:lens fiber membrane intrinsic protein isoform X1 [Suricata suricatta]|uniref:lens fiber membrane intrinsic protein isoform X1 n=1 Tax=Suricata suricatta TaxID=37032 RepID=UPI0011552A97|nr:lens fiber membrane intrinsic protein isoform X1 [Suricata suricatta]
MYSFMGGGLFCAWVGTILLMVATATDHWMQYRLSGSFAHQGLWRYCLGSKCYLQTESIGKARSSAGPGLGSRAPSGWASEPPRRAEPLHLVCKQRTVGLREGKGPAKAYWNATRAFMILSSLCATSGIIMGILAFAQQPTLARLSRPFSSGILFFASTFFVLLALAIYTGVTVSFLGRRFGDWRFSWSYILGWVALLMTFFAGIFYMCAYRMHECRRPSAPR